MSAEDLAGPADPDRLDDGPQAPWGPPALRPHDDAFFENNPFPCFLLRAGGALARVNARFTQATGYATAELDGRSIEDLLSRRDVEELYGYHRAKLRHRDATFEYECDLVREGGTEIRVVLTMNIAVAGGFVLGALRDVTEERRLSRALQAQNEELHQVTALLHAAQEELHGATQLATLGEVSGRVAHELLNPLTAILSRTVRMAREVAKLGEVAALARTGASPAASETAETLDAVLACLDEYRAGAARDVAFVSEELVRIQRLVDGLRGAAPATAFRARVSLSSLLHYAREVMDAVIVRSQTTCTIACPEGVTLEVDRGEIIQALTNLVRNATEAHEELPAGAPRVLRIEARVSGPPGPSASTDSTEGAGPATPTVAILVSDTGPGVPREVESRLFEPSFTTRARGTGLGLAIARRLVRAHAGELVLLPSDGRGATFQLTLPCTLEASRARALDWEG